MPEVNTKIQWPDEKITICYSPSTVIREYFHEGMTVSVTELVRKIKEALDRACLRVEVKLGVRCNKASENQHMINSQARKFRSDETVKIVSMEQI